MIPSVAAAELRHGVEDFLRSTFPVSTPALHGLLDPLFAPGSSMFRGPFLAIDLPFEPGEDGGHGTGEPFPEVPLGFRPYRHQQRAFRRLGGAVPRATLVATGTGSGKTECFLWPILDHCRHHAGQPGIKALIIYPMNALATDQARRIAQVIWRTRSLRGRVRAGLYVGETEKQPNITMSPDMVITDRESLRDGPPDILMTNYKMLDYLLLRPRDRKLWARNGPETLRFLVVDELHTFDGAQGTDLACLIRRLRDRLGVPPDQLCCVGTSATLGAGQDTGPLRDYAERVFATPFDADSVVVEERKSVGRFLEAVFVEPRGVPGPEHAEALRADRYANFEDFLRAQVRLWLGREREPPEDLSDPAWRVGLCEPLLAQPFFQNLLRVLGGRVRALDDVLAELRLRNCLPDPPPGDDRGRYHQDLIDSLCTLVAVARQWRPEDPEQQTAREREAKPRPTAPFLKVRVQLWLRELRRMVGAVSDRPVLRFSDDLTDEELKVHLPVVHCMDCDSTGWAGLVRSGESGVQADLKEFYTAFFAEGRDVTFFFPTVRSGRTAIGMGPGEQAQLCPSCLHVTPRLDAGSCSACGHEGLIPVFIPDNKGKRGERLIGSHDCPYCGARSGLTILGSQSASLSSVMLGTLFASRFLEDADRKVIAFSDSVQDAAHRAGFFGARTYRLNFRSALQQAIQAVGDDLTLAELPGAFAAHWVPLLGEADYVATFLPSDMAWLKDFEELKRTGQMPEGNLRRLVDKRVEWEILSEYGLRARVGRTLERSGASVAHPDPARLDAVAAALLPVLREEIGCLRGLDAPVLRRFLLGLIAHLRLQGGILHPFVESYLAQRGNTFVLGNALWMPRFGPHTRAPTFLISGFVEHGRLERVLSRSGRKTWCMSWAEKALGPLAPEISAYLDDLYRRTLDGLQRQGLLDQRAAGADRAWGLPAPALRVTTRVAQLRCDTCRHEVSAAAGPEAEAWAGAPCLRAHCPGIYRPAAARCAAWWRTSIPGCWTATRASGSRTPSSTATGAGTPTSYRRRRRWRWASTSATCRRSCCARCRRPRPTTCSASAAPAGATATRSPSRWRPVIRMTSTSSPIRKR